jgi:tetratricopeptide (TPR) repeat protein
MKRALVVAFVLVLGCRSRVPTDPPGAATAMGDWSEWRDLSPLVEVVRDHAPEPAAVAIERASALLREGKPRSADRTLADASGGAGHHWIAVARGDLAALHFALCIRGVAWRLVDGQTPSPTDRKADFSEATRVEPGDISVEATLTNLDAAIAAGEETLGIQARIARARVAAFAQQCAPTDEVAQMAQSVVEADLATLAAEGHLTPDLAYMWAGVQMSRFSGSAARPFLLQAREGGFDHPAVIFMLAVIALELRELDQAEQLGKEATEVYAKLGDRQHQAEGRYLLGEIARAKKQGPRAREHYDAALALDPTHGPSILARADFEAQKDADSATQWIKRAMDKLWLDGALDAQKARAAAENIERLLSITTEPHQVQLVRDALLLQVDTEPDAMRRGLRYFFAATLDVRLREYEIAHGHGVLAKEEFAESGVQAPVDVEAFLSHLRQG